MIVFGWLYIFRNFVVCNWTITVGCLCCRCWLFYNASKTHLRCVCVCDCVLQCIMYIYVWTYIARFRDSYIFTIPLATQKFAPRFAALSYDNFVSMISRTDRRNARARAPYTHSICKYISAAEHTQRQRTPPIMEGQMRDNIGNSKIIEHAFIAYMVIMVIKFILMLTLT